MITKQRKGKRILRDKRERLISQKKEICSVQKMDGIGIRSIDWVTMENELERRIEGTLEDRANKGQAIECWD